MKWTFNAPLTLCTWCMLWRVIWLDKNWCIGTDLVYTSKIVCALFKRHTDGKPHYYLDDATTTFVNYSSGLLIYPWNSIYHRCVHIICCINTYDWISIGTHVQPLHTLKFAHCESLTHYWKHLIMANLVLI